MLVKRKQESIDSTKAAEAKRVKLVIAALCDSHDTLNMLENKHLGDLNKLTVPQMKNLIIRQTMAPIKTKKGVRMNNSYSIKIINKTLSDEPCEQDFRAGV